MKTYTVNETIKAIETGHLAELSLTAEQLAALKNRDGVTALHLAVEHGCLDQIKDGVTADQLAKTVADDGMSALLYATYKGCLTQVKGGVTVAQLKAQKNPQGGTGLFIAAQEGHLHQVQGDITAAELAADQVSDHTSALLAAAFNGELFLLKGGVTVEELAAARADDGNTALHTAADSRSLDQITGGATLQQLTAIKDAKGRTPLYWAALNGCINQIQGGVTLEQMRATLCDGNKSAFEVALENRNQDQIPGADPGGPDFTSRTEEELIELANMTCWWAQESIKKGEKKLGCRMLEKLAIDLSNHGPVCVVLTQAYMGLGNRKEGLKYACKAVKLTPGDSDAWRQLGHIHYILHQLPKALAALQQAVEVNANSAEALVLLAIIKSDLNHDIAETEALSRRAVLAEPTNLRAWQWLAAHLEANGKSEESDRAHARYCELKLGDKAKWIRDAEGTPMVALVSGADAGDLDQATPTGAAASDEPAFPRIDPAEAKLKFQAIMEEAAVEQPGLTAAVEAFEQNLVKTFDLPAEHQVVTPGHAVGALPAWFNDQPKHFIYYPEELTAAAALRHRASCLMQLQVASECARTNGWVAMNWEQTPGFARMAYLKHGFGTVAKEMVRAGHAEEAVKAAQEKLIGSMTANMVALVMGMVVETRLARDLPGLPPDGLPMLDDEWHETGNPQSPKKFCELAPEKIAWRWRILHHAYALVVDGVAGTHFAEKYFANFDGANAAARIADYCRQAIGRMKPGDEPAIIREAIRMAKLQDFLSLQKLMVNLEQIRKGPGAASGPMKKDPWLESFEQGQAELRRAAGRVPKGQISAIRSQSAARHVILQGRNGESGAAGFFTWDAQAATELEKVRESLNGRCIHTHLVTPKDGVNYWGLIAKFKPFARYSKDDQLSVGVYLQEQVASLDECLGRNNGAPVA